MKMMGAGGDDDGDATSMAQSDKKSDFDDDVAPV
jgi:hypothetical protein